MEHKTGPPDKPELTTRIIVLIYGCPANGPGCAQEIYEVAFNKGTRDIYFLIIDGEDQLKSVLSCIVKVKAILAGYGLEVEYESTKVASWLTRLQELYRQDDLIVYQEEETVFSDSFKLIPMGDFLATQMNANVHSISIEKRQNPKKTWYQEVIPWVSLAVILVFFTWLEITIEVAFEDPIQTVLVSLTLFVEIGIIWIWYRKLYRSD